VEENFEKNSEGNQPAPRHVHHMRMMNHHCGGRGERSQRVIVKGYMRPDKTSYYVVIPKEVREQMGLKGGEYFIMKAWPAANEINLKLAKFADEPEP
jgi:hypothetical protein